MAKISQLPQATTIDGTEQMLGVQSGITKRFNAALLKGIKGDTGATGPTGATGAASTVPGPQGETGQAGSNGLSAYQIALANGYTGTEKQWLRSLKGSASDYRPTRTAGATLYLHKTHGGF